MSTHLIAGWWPTAVVLLGKGVMMPFHMQALKWGRIAGWSYFKGPVHSKQLDVSAAIANRPQSSVPVLTCLVSITHRDDASSDVWWWGGNSYPVSLIIILSTNVYITPGVNSKLRHNAVSCICQHPAFDTEVGALDGHELLGWEPPLERNETLINQNLATHRILHQNVIV